MGDVIADAMYEATKPEDFGGAVAAFMNVGGVRSSLLYSQISGGEQPGEVTYAEAFAVQPFGNTLVVKTCTGQQIVRRARAAVREPGCRPAARDGGRPRLTLLVHARLVPAGTKRVLDGSLKIGGVAVDKAAGYRVAMNNFIADGGDGFSVFRSCTNPLGGEVDIDALRALLEGTLAGCAAAR